LRFWGPLWGT